MEPWSIVGSGLDGLQKSQHGPRGPKEASTNLLAGVLGGLAGVGVGLLILAAAAAVSPNPSYPAIAVPLGICAIISVLAARRSRRRLIRHAAGGFALTCVLQLLLYAGAG